MIPRFANPHTVLEKTQIVSKKSLDVEEDGFSPPDSSLVKELDTMMKRTLPQFDVERAMKRRKVEANVEDVNRTDVMEEPILFRLISSGPPVPVSLKPKPQAFIKVKEPETEDTEAQAQERREQALAVAVDADWVKKESLKSCQHPSTQTSVLHIILPSPLKSASAVMVLGFNKAVRNARPPVDSKLGYPYDASARPDPLQTLVQGCPVIDLNYTLNDTNTEKRRRKRRRKVKKIKHEFWRPDPQIKGKCMGYAMGYQ